MAKRILVPQAKHAGGGEFWLTKDNIRKSRQCVITCNGMCEGEQLWVECERLRRAYWDSISRCATLHNTGQAEADRQRIAARDALQNFKGQACQLCAKCMHR